MAYTQVQTLVDTDRRHVTKRVNSGNTESSALLVNASALAYATVNLLTVASANNFKIGETVTAAAGGTAIVQDVVNSTMVIVSTVSGTFTNAQSVTGGTSGKVRTQDAALANATYSLHVSRVLYVVGGPDGSSVSMEWEGTSGGANNRTIAILAGSGALELDTHMMRANNTANSATGNIILSTTNWNANSHYTLFVDVSKVGGYAAPYLERNQTLGY